MWNQTLNLKKLGSSKLKLVDFRIESKLNEPRVEFADGKDSAVSIYEAKKLNIYRQYFPIYIFKT